MIKTLLLVLLFVACSGSLFCQSLTGTVYDEHSNVIPGASVYFNGTTIGTVTDENGKFRISMDSIVSTSLIIGSLGYESVSIKTPFSKSEIQVYLTSKLFELPEVVVNAKKSKIQRERYLNVFKGKFLGTSPGGTTCRIINEDDIILKFDKQTNTLHISTDTPIIIENPYLGYLINFYPVDCNIKFENENVLTRNVSCEYYFLGRIYFTDTGNHLRSVLLRRKSAYEGSRMHFFRNFYNNYWTPDEFLLYRESTSNEPINPNEYFEISDTSGLKKISVIDSGSIKNGNKSENVKESFSEPFKILFDGSDVTQIIFKTNLIFLDKYGNYDPLGQVEFNGAMSEKRIGYSLPLDFKLE